MVGYFASGFILAEGGDTVTQITAGMFVALWVLVCYLWFCKSKYTFHSMVVAFLPITILVTEQWYRRVVFIVEYGAMDYPNCMGSPLAFLLGIILEVSIFLPGLIGLFIVRHRD